MLSLVDSGICNSLKNAQDQLKVLSSYLKDEIHESAVLLIVRILLVLKVKNIY